MPNVLYYKFKLNDLEPTLLELQLAGGSIWHPYGKLDDVIVNVENYMFLGYFIIVDMKVINNLTHAPIILGRAFLATTHATTKWKKGVVELKVGEERVKPNIPKLIKHLRSS